MMTSKRLKPNLRRANDAEREAYSKTDPVYPLGYYGNMYDENGERHVVAVEDLRGSWSRPDPVWEIICPPGYVAEDCHSLLCYDLGDVRDRMTADLWKCDCDECSQHWESVK